MGGHTSKQTIGASTNVAASIVQNTAQNCINVAYGDNTVSINGDYNSVTGVAQEVSVTINSDCSTFASQNSSFDSDLANSLSQILADQEVALTQWIDSSRDDQESHVAQSVTANFTQNAVQTCVNNLTGINNLYVSGDGNVIKNVTQDATLNVISQCLLRGAQTSDVVADITNTVNQHGTYVSKNPLAFIADAFEAVTESVVAAAAAFFIVIVCFVFLFAAMRRGKKGAGQAPIVIQTESTSPGRPGYGYGPPAGNLY